MAPVWSPRAFVPSTDLSRLAEFLVRARSVVGHCGFYHLGDLSWNLYLAELRGRPPNLLRIWEDSGGQIAGFAWFYPPDTVDVQSAPWLSNRDALEEEMLDWAEAVGREHTEEGAPRRLSVEAFEQDERFTTLLDWRGFRRGADYKRHMVWDLTRPVPTPVLPEGFSIRPVTDGDLPWRGELQRSVWPWSRMSAESYPRLRTMPGYRSELDLVAVAPTGDLCCFGICWVDGTNRVGEFEPVGTHPAFRGRGLAKALLHHALHRLVELGATAALVYPPGGEKPAVRLYESAGFQPLQNMFTYTMPLEG